MHVSYISFLLQCLRHCCAIGVETPPSSTFTLLLFCIFTLGPQHCDTVIYETSILRPQSPSPLPKPLAFPKP